MVSAIRSVTVGVSSLAESLKLFRDTMGLKEEFAVEAPSSLLDAWAVPKGTKARLVELSCKGYPYGRLRLAEYTPKSTQKVRLDFGADALDTSCDIGPKAIDFYVADPIQNAIKKLESAGYKARSVPRKHQIGRTISEELLISGPDDLPMLLMVAHRHAATSLRPGSPDGEFSEIATVSVICADLEQSRKFYGEILGLTLVNDAETPDEYRDLVCEMVDVPRGTRIHILLYAQRGEASGKILLVHFFDRSGKRLVGRMRPGHLGFSLMTHDTSDIDGLHETLRRSGAKIISKPVAVQELGYAYSAMLVQGPNEELFEFVQKT